MRQPLFSCPKNIFLFWPKTVIIAIPSNLQLNRSWRSAQIFARKADKNIFKIAHESGYRKEKTQGKLTERLSHWKATNKEQARQQICPTPARRRWWQAVGGARGKWKNEVHPLYFFIFDSVKKRRKNKATCKNKILQPKAERFCALFEAGASSQKRFQRERFIPLDARKRPRTYGKCYDSAATRSGLSKHVTRFSYPSPDRTQSIKKVVLVLTHTSIT